MQPFTFNQRPAIETWLLRYQRFANASRKATFTINTTCAFATCDQRSIGFRYLERRPQPHKLCFPNNASYEHSRFHSMARLLHTPRPRCKEASKLAARQKQEFSKKSGTAHTKTLMKETVRRRLAGRWYSPLQTKLHEQHRHVPGHGIHAGANLGYRAFGYKSLTYIGKASRERAIQVYSFVQDFKLPVPDLCFEILFAQSYQQQFRALALLYKVQKDILIDDRFLNLPKSFFDQADEKKKISTSYTHRAIRRYLDSFSVSSSKLKTSWNRDTCSIWARKSKQELNKELARDDISNESQRLSIAQNVFEKQR